MTFRPHLYLQFGGRFFSTEQWSCGLRMSLGEPGPQNLTSDETRRNWAIDNIDDVAQDVLDWFVEPSHANSSAARLDYVKLNPIGPDGRYAFDDETIEFRWADGEAQPGPRTPTFPQITCCVSLLTAAQRGRGSRGRFYPPTGLLDVSATTGRLNLGSVQTVLDGAQSLLDNLANQPGPDLQSPRVVVASDLGTPGPMRNVTAVAVGNVIDTQRRRRNELVEEYQQAVVTIV